MPAAAVILAWADEVELCLLTKHPFESARLRVPVDVLLELELRLSAYITVTVQTSKDLRAVRRPSRIQTSDLQARRWSSSLQAPCSGRLPG